MNYRLVAVFDEEMKKVIALTTQCNSCKKIYKIPVDISIEKYNHWKAGNARVQDAFPELSADDREILISEVCGKCFDLMFNKDEIGN